MKTRLIAALAALLAFLLISAAASDAAYMIHDYYDGSDCFSVSKALDETSKGTIILQDNGQTYAIPVYHAAEGCTVQLENEAAQLRLFRLSVEGGIGSIDWSQEIMPTAGKSTVTLASGVQTINAAEIADYTAQLVGAWEHRRGVRFTLDTPGCYLASHSRGGLMPSTVVLLVGEEKTDTPAPPSAPTAPSLDQRVAVSASQNRAPVLVNGKRVEFDAYTIDGFNYFKLRDLAAALNGTPKQFAVAWNAADSTIALTSGALYELAGGELTAGPAGEQPAYLSTSAIYKDGVPMALVAYTIRQNNYFKLRDLGQLFRFGVSWDNDAMCILIDTSIDYTP